MFGLWVGNIVNAWIKGWVDGSAEIRKIVRICKFIQNSGRSLKLFRCLCKSLMCNSDSGIGIGIRFQGFSGMEELELN